MVLAQEMGRFVINKTYDTKRHVGQKLVSDLINAPEVVNVNIGGDQNGDPNIKWSADNDPDGIIQIYIDPDDTLNNGRLFTYVDSPVGAIPNEFQQYIVFGHELIHAWREIHGMFDGNVEKGITPYDYMYGITTDPAEEMKTMGINYLDPNGQVRQNYSTYEGIISENGLRLENGLPLRVSYQGWWIK